MYARVVRFTDVDPDHLAERLAEGEAREGPPVDIPAVRGGSRRRHCGDASLDGKWMLWLLAWSCEPWEGSGWSALKCPRQLLA